jgi:seryl-tRNA synthetase
MNPLINYRLLAKAEAFYQEAGYQLVSVPWTTGNEAIQQVTAPLVEPQEVKGLGFLVGSAEQSFLAEAVAGRLLPGRYVATTPCFRTEKEYDDIHRPYFMKTELFYLTSAPRRKDLVDMVQSAWSFFESLGIECEVVLNRDVNRPDAGSFDINAIMSTCPDIELGSYGIRHYQGSGLSWVYGTGLAEPRTSVVLNRLKIERNDGND